MINAIISFIWGVGITLLVIKLHQIYRYKKEHINIRKKFDESAYEFKAKQHIFSALRLMEPILVPCDKNQPAVCKSFSEEERIEHNLLCRYLKGYIEVLQKNLKTKLNQQVAALTKEAK